MITGTLSLSVPTYPYPGRSGTHHIYYGACVGIGNWVYFSVTFQIAAPLTAALARINVVTGAYEHVAQLSASNTGAWSLAASADGATIHAVNYATQKLVNVTVATGEASAELDFPGMGQGFSAAPYLDGKHVTAGLDGARIVDFAARTWAAFTPLAGAGAGLGVCSPSAGTTIWSMSRSTTWGLPGLYVVSPADKPDFLRFIGGTMEDGVAEIPDGPFTYDYLTFRGGTYIAADAEYLYVLYRGSNPRRLLKINIATGQATFVAALGNYKPFGLCFAGGKLVLASEGTIAAFL